MDPDCNYNYKHDFVLTITNTMTANDKTANMDISVLSLTPHTLCLETETPGGVKKKKRKKKSIFPFVMFTMNCNSDIFYVHGVEHTCISATLQPSSQ
jgi:hypothetical protein